jgi:protein involved in polysaccharide export with SLBB domain
MFSISIVNRVVGACGLFISMFALAACDSDPTPTVKATETARVASTSGGDVDYRLGANDRVRIIVFGQPTLTGEYTLDGNGNPGLPADR